MKVDLDAAWAAYQTGSLSITQLVVAFEPTIAMISGNFGRGIYSPRFDKDDLKQEGRIALLQAVERYDSTKSNGVTFSAWAKRTIAQRMIDYLRQVNYDPRNPKKPQEFGMTVPDFIDPDNPYEQVDEEIYMEWFTDTVREVLEEHIYRLPEKQQLILKYRYEDELSIQEIADLLGSGPKSIYSQHREAIETLRESIREEEVSAWA